MTRNIGVMVTRCAYRRNPAAFRMKRGEISFTLENIFNSVTAVGFPRFFLLLWSARGV
jgi:hypothetical protein